MSRMQLSLKLKLSLLITSLVVLTVALVSYLLLRQQQQALTEQMIKRGHTIADNFAQSDAPALSSIQRAHWVDYGADFYAATSFNDLPDGNQVLIGWMNNWNYAGSIPTSPWRCS